MSNMQAALGLAQLERIEELIARKRQIFVWYQEALCGVDGITLNYEAPGTKNTYWMVTVILDPSFGIDKEQLIRLLSEHHIDSRPFFYPLSSLPAYEHLEQARQARQRNRVSYQISPYAINLPSGLNMTEEKVRYVCDALRDILQQ
jgi:perosamine synthetase